AYLSPDHVDPAYSLPGQARLHYIRVVREPVPQKPEGRRRIPDNLVKELASAAPRLRRSRLRSAAPRLRRSRLRFAAPRLRRSRLRACIAEAPKERRREYPANGSFSRPTPRNVFAHALENRDLG